ncbi:MAG: hypothetical protein ABL921_11895 [Pirellula sp.]
MLFRILCMALICVVFANKSVASLVLIGFNADGNDGMAAVALTNFGAGTVFRFTDNEWSGTAFNSGEGFLSFTNTNAIAAGTILRFSSLSSSPVIVDGFGNSVLGTISGMLDLNASDEGLYAYVGFDFQNVTQQFASVLTSNSTGGTAFTASGAASVTLSPSNGDVYAYTGSTNINATSFLDYVPLISNPSNWALQGDGTGDQSGSFMPKTGVFQITAVPEPSSILFGIILAGGGWIKWRYRRRSLNSMPVHKP